MTKIPEPESVLPWRKKRDSFGDIRIMSASDHFVCCSGIRREEDADQIVTACNTFPELVESVSVLDEWHDHHAADAPEWDEDSRVSISISIGDLRRARSLLNRIGGEADG